MLSSGLSCGYVRRNFPALSMTGDHSPRHMPGEMHLPPRPWGTGALVVVKPASPPPLAQDTGCIARPRFQVPPLAPALLLRSRPKHLPADQVFTLDPSALPRSLRPGSSRRPRQDRPHPRVPVLHGQGCHHQGTCPQTPVHFTTSHPCDPGGPWHQAPGSPPWPSRSTVAAPARGPV